MTLVTVDIEHEIHGFNGKAYERWSLDDGETFERIYTITGDLGRGEGALGNQRRGSANEGGQHFPEMHYAARLIEQHGVSRDEIVYENFYVCRSMLTDRTPAGKARAGLKFTNTRNVLGAVLSDRFFREMTSVFDANPSLIGNKSREWMAVDLFAIDRTNRRCHFVECKRLRPAGRTEEVQKQQKLTLAAAQHVAKTLGDAAFTEPGYSMSCRVVVFREEGTTTEPSKNYAVPFPFTV